MAPFSFAGAKIKSFFFAVSGWSGFQGALSQRDGREFLHSGRRSGYRCGRRGQPSASGPDDPHRAGRDSLCHQQFRRADEDDLHPRALHEPGQGGRGELHVLRKTGRTLGLCPKPQKGTEFPSPSALWIASQSGGKKHYIS